MEDGLDFDEALDKPLEGDAYVTEVVVVVVGKCPGVEDTSVEAVVVVVLVDDEDTDEEVDSELWSMWCAAEDEEVSTNGFSWFEERSGADNVSASDIIKCEIV